MKKVRDHYFQKAKKEGFAARAVYKLEEIDQRRKILKPGQNVLDLGAAPGSWLQYAAQKVGSKGRVIGVDLQKIDGGYPDQVEVRVGDVFTLKPEDFEEGVAPFDVILSDMAPKTTGIRNADAARSAELVRKALELSHTLLAPGGVLLAKIFQGGELAEVRKSFSEYFQEVTLEKPKASRSESVEVFLLGRGRK